MFRPAHSGSNPRSVTRVAAEQQGDGVIRLVEQKLRAFEWQCPDLNRGPEDYEASAQGPGSSPDGTERHDSDAPPQHPVAESVAHEATDPRLRAVIEAWPTLPT